MFLHSAASIPICISGSTSVAIGGSTGAWPVCLLLGHPQTMDLLLQALFTLVAAGNQALCKQVYSHSVEAHFTVVLVFTICKINSLFIKISVLSLAG